MKTAEEKPSVRARILRWCSIYLTERPLVFILAAIVGIGTGVMAWLLKTVISFLYRTARSTIGSVGPDWLMLVAPVVGVLFVVFLLYKVFKVDVTHGVRRMQADIRRHSSNLPAKLTYVPLLTTSITLGFGGSAGAEGPIAYSGAALGSTVARMFRLSAPMAMLMMVTGAGAGIAAIFKAPIGGAMFVLEILRSSVGAFGVMVLFVSTLFAGLTAMALGGFSLDLVFGQVTSYPTSILPWVILLGIFCGVYSIYYSYVMKLVEHLLGLMKNRWVKGAVSAGLLGLILITFPALYGEGYAIIRHILQGDTSVISFGTAWTAIGGDAFGLFMIALCILLIKCFATSLSYNGGGVTGEFAPTLFAGCFAGYVFAVAVNWLTGCSLPVGQIAFIAMAGVMAGVIRAPLMAMFIVAEISSAYTLLLPLALVSGISYGIVRLFTSDSFFAKEMDRNNGLLHFLRVHKHRQPAK